MTLKNIIYTSLTAVTAALITNSCSDISEEERYIYVKPADVKRSVLIEDFTGQMCVNCPDATNEIESFIEQYGDAAIAVGIHSGPLGFTTNNRYLGLKTTLGDEYYNHWTIDSQPKGLINRSSGVLLHTQWAASVRSELEKATSVTVELENTYDEASRTVSINVATMNIDNDYTGNLQVWILEDSITAFQRMQDGSYNYEYVHNHVFRDAVNGSWGEQVSMTMGNILTKAYTYTLPDDWVAKNVSVVAFVYDDSGVQQAAKKAVISEAAADETE